MIPSSRIKKVHFVGIGGTGMSGIAEVLHANGFVVSGSDLTMSARLQQLKNQGVSTYVGHSAQNIGDADLVVYSSAVRMENEELQEARKRKIPIIRRAEMLGELMRLKYTLAIAGTHGKTTTTSLVGHIWTCAQKDPTIIVGGILRNLGTSSQSGKGEVLVAESDEYDRSFLEMMPTLAIITNVDNDHLDCYGTMDEIRKAFVSFANKVPFYGQVFLCIDETGVQEIMPHIKKPVVTYGFSRQSDYRAENPIYKEGYSIFKVWGRGVDLGEFKVALPGVHNIKNATGAIAMATEEGIATEVIQSALASFTGVQRRFEFITTIANTLVYDDYGHHPTEVEVTLKAARDMFPGRKIIAVFQPHLYSRTRDLHIQFGSAFIQSDVLFMLPVYGSREDPIPGINNHWLCEVVRSMGHRRVETVETLEEACQKSILEAGQEECVILAMGAGSIWKLRDMYSAKGADCGERL
jgi:UDP-N-acetylmuramate--alanine ligase